MRRAEKMIPKNPQQRPSGLQPGAASISRRSFGRVAAAIGASVGVSSLPGSLVYGTPLDRKASPNEKSPAELVTPAAKKAIDKALGYLVRSQIKTGRKRGAFGSNGYAAGVATASLGGLALMCGGHAPGQGPYGRAIDMCTCLLYTSPSPRDATLSRMPSSA